MLSGNKPLPEPILKQIHVTIWRHKATMNDSTDSFPIAGFKERWFKVHGNLLFYFRTNEMGYQLEGEVKLTH